MKISWGDIEKSIETLRKVDGGFSPAHRGIVTLPDGVRAFVKVGVNDSTKQWAKKEIEDRLNADAFHWLTEFWFKAAATPIWPGGPAHLRDVQLQSAITAWHLEKRVYSTK